MGKMLKIPVRAKYRIENGKAVFVGADYVEADAETVADFFVQQYNKLHPGKEVSDERRTKQSVLCGYSGKREI